MKTHSGSPDADGPEAVKGLPFRTRARSEIVTEERAFLKAILERPEDDASKLVYADWLEEQGDPRGEYLRLMMAVRQERVVTPGQRQRHQELSAELAELLAQGWQAWRENQRRMQELEGQLADLSQQIRQQVPARLQELAATLDPNWLAVVSDPEIEGCGKSVGEARQLRFDFVCDKTWADMRPTDDKSVRHCEACRKDVYYCDNLADAREHSQEGRCIAVDLGIIRHERDLVPRTMFLGRPSKEAVRRTYEEDLDPVSQARLEARKQARKKATRRR
jgi:uncharacterized protein (TIGR02996 family)